MGLLGERLVAGSPQETVTLPLESLRKHTVILAGAGSGKTVLLKRLLCGPPGAMLNLRSRNSENSGYFPGSPPEDSALGPRI